jgi:hypothetical protein
MAITINGTTGIAGVDGSASTPAVQGTDTNTGIFYPAADTIAFGEGGAEVARFDSNGRLGIGTSSPGAVLDVNGAALFAGDITNSNGKFYVVNTYGYFFGGSANLTGWQGSNGTQIIQGFTGGSERVRITSGGDLLVGKTASSGSTNGVELLGAGTITAVRSSEYLIRCNRRTSDGELVVFDQDGTQEGSISVSGTTVSYNGGHLSRWAQMLTKPDLLKGTVMSNLDEMNVYTDAEGNPVDNEQLNKVKVSDVEGDINVAGVFVNWTYDDAHQVDEINMAMTGDMIIRIAQGVTVQKGDLLMSAGDGTAKPQDDDIVRSKTVAKVTSNHVTCTYADGSYCVPCVLMAC